MYTHLMEKINMKKILTLLLVLAVSSSLFASAAGNYAGIGAGIFMNFGAVRTDSNDNALVLSAGPAISAIYDYTKESSSAFTYGFRGRADSIIGIDDPSFFGIDIFAGPKGTIKFSDKVSLNLAIGFDLGYSKYHSEANNQVRDAKTTSIGFGPDLFLDIDINDSWGIGLGYIGKIAYDVKTLGKDKCLILSSDVYVNAYYRF